MKLKKPNEEVAVKSEGLEVWMFDYMLAPPSRRD